MIDEDYSFLFLYLYEVAHVILRLLNKFRKTTRGAAEYLFDHLEKLDKSSKSI